MLDLEKIKIQRYLELKGVNPDSLSNIASYYEMTTLIQNELIEVIADGVYIPYIPASSIPKEDEYRFYMSIMDNEIIRIENEEKKKEKRFKIVNVVKNIKQKLLVRK